MSETLVESLSASIEDAGGQSATINTDGRLIRPLLAIPAALVDEMKFVLDHGEVRARANDPANVALFRFRVPSAAFDDYELDGDGASTVGVNLSSLRSNLRDARLGKRTADPVELCIQSSHTRISIEREYGDTTVTRYDEVRNLDADRLRERPDLPDVPFSWAANVDVQAFTDTIDHVTAEYDHVDIGEQGGDLVLAGANKGSDNKITQSSSAEFSNVVEPAADDFTEGAVSKFSLDYLADIADALSQAKVDELTLRFGEELPLLAEFARTDDGELVYEGEFMQAPRITQ